MEGYTYVGVGNSTSKKDAQFNAVKDFLNYFVREGYIKASDVPQLQVSLKLKIEAGRQILSNIFCMGCPLAQQLW